MPTKTIKEKVITRHFKAYTYDLARKDRAGLERGLATFRRILKNNEPLYSNDTRVNNTTLKAIIAAYEAALKM